MQNLVRPEDHEAGFKDLTIRYRNGKEEVVRLHAPNHRDALRLARAFGDHPEGVESDSSPIIRACLGLNSRVQFDRLTPVSFSTLESVSLTLTFGEPEEKKAEAGTPAPATDSTPSDAK